MRACHAFAQPRGKAGIAHLHFAGDALKRRTDTLALPCLVYSKPQHFSPEIFAVPAATTLRELPDVCHFVEENRHERGSLRTGADVKRN